MELELSATKPPLLALSASGGTFTVFGDVLVYVVQPSNSSVKTLAFVLGSVSTMHEYVYIAALYIHVSLLSIACIM